MPILEKDNDIRKILAESKNVAVYGITKDAQKPAYYVPKVLKDKGFKLIGVNPKYAGEEILGAKVLKSLAEIPDEIDVILIFRPPSEVPQILKEAYIKGFKTFWMQPGTVNDEVKRELNEKGYNVVAGKCMKIESEKLLK
ncbi:MAG: CoA-binding protein [Deltaproteobacteria bacterium]|nr:CoA-binding protein [Deltaproteobacteria bacterium]